MQHQLQIFRKNFQICVAFQINFAPNIQLVLETVDK